MPSLKPGSSSCSSDEVFSDQPPVPPQTGSEVDVSHNASQSSHDGKLDGDGSTDDSGINCDGRSEGSDKSEIQDGGGAARGMKRAMEEEDDLDDDGEFINLMNFN